jgi:hypothetical protein
MRAEEAKTASDTRRKQPLRCERVNEITFKVTDGEMSRVPASLGKWGGSRLGDQRWKARMACTLW